MDRSRLSPGNVRTPHLEWEVAAYPAIFAGSGLAGPIAGPATSPPRTGGTVGTGDGPIGHIAGDKLLCRRGLCRFGSPITWWPSESKPEPESSRVTRSPGEPRTHGPESMGRIIYRAPAGQTRSGLFRLGRAGFRETAPSVRTGEAVNPEALCGSPQPRRTSAELSPTLSSC